MSYVEKIMSDIIQTTSDLFCPLATRWKTKTYAARAKSDNLLQIKRLQFYGNSQAEDRKQQKPRNPGKSPNYTVLCAKGRAFVMHALIYIIAKLAAGAQTALFRGLFTLYAPQPICAR